jgi:hypothetical protein
MTSQTQSNIQGTLLLLLLFCPVSEVAPSQAENNTLLGNTFFITSMYLGTSVIRDLCHCYALASAHGTTISIIQNGRILPVRVPILF